VAAVSSLLLRAFAFNTFLPAAKLKFLYPRAPQLNSPPQEANPHRPESTNAATRMRIMTDFVVAAATANVADVDVDADASVAVAVSVCFAFFMLPAKAADKRRP